MSDTPFRVVKILSETELVLNAGSDHEVKKSDQFVIFELGDEVIDPESGENLGRLELLRGTGEAIHVQARMSTIRSSEKKKASPDITTYAGLRFAMALPSTALIEVTAPFVDAKVGDLARKL